MTVHADHWQRALALVDTAVTLDADQRDAWLAEVSAAEPDVAPLLQKLLSAHRRVETNDLLATLPRQQRDLVAPSTGQRGSRVGPFELIEHLGQGGMGSVWRARYADGHLKRDVAVKLPATSSNPAALASLAERFSRERDFLAQLEHPNIARLYDSGVSDTGQPFLAMEYVAGEPIDRFCDGRCLPIKTRLLLYLQVLDAVEFAHRRLVLHRDLKPANVLVDANGQVRLLDFGIAKLLPDHISTKATSTSKADDNALTEMTGAAITLAYAAPEQISNGNLSTATDVYALGVMLYYLLTGSTPYQPKRDSRGALEDAVLTVEPTIASARVTTPAIQDARQTTEAGLRRLLAGDLDTILAKALKKNPDERYPTAAALADDLRRHIAQQPITARPDSLAYRGSRFVARHRVAVAATALGITALLVTTAVAVWQAQIATASATRANKEAARASTAQKFLSGMFASADPEQSKTSSAAAQEILTRSVAAAEVELAHDPEAHALVLERIADIYRRMGMFEELLATQKRRVAVVESSPSLDVNALIDAQLELGRALGDTNDAKDNAAAMPMLKTAYDNAVQRGASAERVVWALSLIADQYRVDQDLVSARDYAAQALAHAERTLVSPNRFLAAAYEANAVVAADQRRIDDARKYFAKAIAIDETGRGRGPVDRCLTLNFLAQLEFADGDYEAALRQSLAIIELIKNNFGDIKSNLAEAVRTAAFSAARAGDFVTAQRLVAEPLDAEVASKHPMRAALAHYSRGRVAAQIEDFARAHQELDLAKPALGTSAIWSSRLQILFSELALREGRAAEALNLAEAVRQSQAAKYGAKHNNMTNTYLWLALSEARAGKTDMARTHMAQSCELLSELRLAHPVRIRCEAYQVLLSSGKSGSEKATALRALQTLLGQSSNKRLLLIPALRAATEQIALIPNGTLPAALFPILDWAPHFMKNRFVAAPGGLSVFSPFCVCAAVLALALSIAPSQTTAQTMKVKGGLEYRSTVASCKPLPTTAVKSVPSPQLRVAPSGAAKQPPLAPSVPSVPSVLMPAASTTWNILPNNSLEYCVNAGVVNDGSGSSGAPLTLTLNDYRGSGDASYREEFAANLDGTPTFPPHVSAPPRTSILTNPVAAHSAAAAPNSWCSTLTDWRKRPHLQLTLTAPGLAQPVTCFVEFKEKVRVVAPQQ